MKREFSEDERARVDAIFEALQDGDFEVEFTEEHDRMVAELVVDGRVFGLPELAAASDDAEESIYRAAVTIGLAVLSSKIEGCEECGVAPPMAGHAPQPFADDYVDLALKAEADRAALESMFKVVHQKTLDLTRSVLSSFISAGAERPDIHIDVHRLVTHCHESGKSIDETMEMMLVLDLSAAPPSQRWIVLAGARASGVFDDPNCGLSEEAVATIEAMRA